MTNPGTDNDEQTTASAASPDAKVTQILEDITQTRAQASGTFGELREQLTPSALMDTAAERVTQAKDEAVAVTLDKVDDVVSGAQDAVADSGRSLLQFVRKNPMPLALTGIGVGWLIFNSRRSTRDERAYGLSTPRRETLDPYDAEDFYDEASPAAAGAGGSTRRRIKGTVADVSRSVEGAASDVAERAGELAHRAQDTLASATRGASERATRSAEKLRAGSRRVGERAQQTYAANPLVVGAAVAVAGTAFGMALPLSRREQELLGGARDGLVREAQGVAKSALDKLQEAAKHAGESE